MRLMTPIVLIAGLAVLASGCGQQRAAPLRAEPRVTVVDPKTNTRRALPMEEYVRGVVAGEMGQLPAAGLAKGDWPPAAYEAQAILARSFAMERLSRGRGKEGAISTDVEEAQAYRPEGITPAIERAVAATRGKTLTHNNAYVRAWFHSYSGGRTATAGEGLGFSPEPPYIKSVELSDNPYPPPQFNRWQATYSLTEVAQHLKAEGGVDIGQLTQVQIAEKGPSGRITRVALTGANGARQVAGPEFRLALGPERMRSTLVDRFEVRGGQLMMSGRGFGHGVGLSQWDAYLFARQGWSAERILQHFFRDVQIRQVWR